ncbi:flagellar protein FlgN [Oerskovia turbata]|uniref:Flagellar protein FlgN n=1 Tax=Oerskovia turbata TaxID=1713 RepID=A0A4Q1KS48_9CELL|nr:flagellar protein FlgN [Oerskovia turbata]RXR23658.1 flagellar protein FlgN [Oerskovia turbata]RXR32928.1 flagellar protein FlgN [Oerskovia turbata]TGJ95223.1 flagellar biosynthesis protein FlgN [Actinotalea fermentans ATCC 43279 = JCM 9966 = DSM 3133]
MGPQELSTLLWRERELLEMLLFKLEEEQLLLTAGRTRWLAHANREVETVMEKVREATLVRTVASETVASSWGLSPDATLREIAAAAPSTGPWREIFEGHLAGLTELTVRIKTVRDTNTQIVNHASRSTQETLATLGGEARTYDATGAATAQSAVARLFDTIL